jgi:DNA excision repair protein ERCC-5
LNKQGNLNTFLDISSGSGTHAPRQRQAYASKRLQQVISDFRKAQKSGSSTPSSRSGSVAVQGEYQSGSSGSEEEERPKKRKRKQSTPIASGSKTKGGSRSGVPAKVSRGRGKARVKRNARGENGRKSTSPGDRDLDMSGEDDAFIPAAVDAVADRDILHEFTLRPRPKPKPKQKSQADAGPSTLRIEEAIDGPEESMSMGA